MDIKQIVIKYLQENGFDGLVEKWSECGCEIPDLMPCDNPSTDCVPGYKKTANPDTGWDFTISTTREV